MTNANTARAVVYAFGTRICPPPVERLISTAALLVTLF